MKPMLSPGSLGDLLVMHLNGLDFGGQADGGEGDDHARGKLTGLNTTDGDSSNTTDLVDVLEGIRRGFSTGRSGE